MIMKKLLTVFSLFAVIFCQGQVKLTKIWETDTILKVPESVLFINKKSPLYVSNIGSAKGWEKLGLGSIATVSQDGKTINNNWVSGLNGPKGMGNFKNMLYVADITEVVVIDIKQGKVLEKIEIAGSEKLNDITISKNGEIYVSDSGKKCIYKIDKNKKVEKYIDSLTQTNGVHLHKEKLYFTDNGKLMRQESDRKITTLVKGLGLYLDGVENIGGEDFIVTTWGGLITYADAKNDKFEVLLDTRNEKINAADLGINKKANIIYIPTFFKNKVVAYQIEKSSKK
jgi:hypothetical protein